MPILKYRARPYLKPHHLPLKFLYVQFWKYAICQIVNLPTYKVIFYKSIFLKIYAICQMSTYLPTSDFKEVDKYPINIKPSHLLANFLYVQFLWDMPYAKLSTYQPAQWFFLQIQFLKYSTYAKLQPTYLPLILNKLINIQF